MRWQILLSCLLCNLVCGLDSLSLVLLGVFVSFEGVVVSSYGEGLSEGLYAFRAKRIKPYNLFNIVDF